MAIHSQLLRILYDPLSYVAGWETVAGMALPPHRRSVLNDLLIHTHALPAYEPASAESAQWVHKLVRYWDSIPAAALLLACSAWRHQLAGHRLLQTLDAQSHIFMRFEFPRKPLASDDLPADRAALLGWGGHSLLQILPTLPAWLTARLQLRFASMPKPRSLPAASPPDLICLSMALAHAQKDPGFRRSVRA